MPALNDLYKEATAIVQSVCNNANVQSFAEVGSNLVTIVGFSITIGGLIYAARKYQKDRQQDKREREYGTFHDLDEKYVQFMYSCAQNPDLDLLSQPMPDGRVATGGQMRAERAHFAVLISIFERATVMFEKRFTGLLGWRDVELEEARKAQWPGWKECMRMYCLRPAFLAEWRAIGGQFDGDFVRTMNQIVREELIAADRAEEVDQWMAIPAATDLCRPMGSHVRAWARIARVRAKLALHDLRRAIAQRRSSAAT